MLIPLPSNPNAFIPGRLSNVERWNSITRLKETAGQIPFGVPVMEGAGTHACEVLDAQAGRKVIGIAEEAQMLTNAGHWYVQGDTVSVCVSGVIGVTLGSPVQKGQQARFDTVNMNWTSAEASGTIIAIPGAEFDRNGSTGGSGVIKYRRFQAQAKAFLATVAAGSIIAANGNSTVAGVSTGNGTAQVASSWPSRYAARLNAKGKKASAQNRFGCASGTFSALLTMDARVTSSGGWTQSASFVPGGNAFSSTAAGSSMTVNLGVCDRAIIYWINNTAGRIANYSVDNGGPSGTLATTGVYRIEKTELTMPVGQHSITLSNNTAAVVIAGVEAYDSTGAMPTRVYNWGISGATSTQVADNSDITAGRRAFYTYLAPDLSIIEGGVINDWRAANISVATSKANMTALVQNAKAVKGGTGKVILMTPVFDNGTAGNTANQEQYVTAMREVAVEQSVPLLDVRAFFRSFSYAQAQGWMSDDVHPSPAGYEVIAQLVDDAVMVG